MTQVLYTIGRTNPRTASGPDKLVANALRWAISLGEDGQPEAERLFDTPEAALKNAVHPTEVSIVRVTIEALDNDTVAEVQL